jgi:hypothetical protein
VAREVTGWVWEENVERLLTHLSDQIGYALDDLDLGAVSAGLASTDADQDRWFRYPLVGRRTLELALARNVGAAPVDVRVTGEVDKIPAARLEMLIAVLSDSAR